MIYLEIERFLHIYCRHVADMQVGDLLLAKVCFSTNILIFWKSLSRSFNRSPTKSKSILVNNRK